MSTYKVIFDMFVGAELDCYHPRPQGGG